MARSKRIEITIRKHDKNFALEVEGELVALVVYRKGATVLEHLLRGCIKYSSRNLFRQALKDALEAKEAPEETTTDKPEKVTKAKPSAQKPKGKAKAKADKDTPTDAPTAPVPPGSDDVSQG